MRDADLGAPPDLDGTPLPLRREVGPPLPFPARALGPLLPAAEAVHTLTQAPFGMCAQSVLAAVSLATQGHADVALPYGAGARAPLTLFLVTIASTGERKSGVDRLTTTAVAEREAELREQHQHDLRTFTADHRAWKAASAEAERKGKGNRETLAAILRGMVEPAPPADPMILCDDVTPEGLVKQLVRGQACLGLFAPEGGTFAGGRAMDDENRLRTAATLNKLWGAEPVRQTRAGEGAVHAEGYRLAMHLMVHPGVAAMMLGKPELGDTGLTARFLLCAPPSTAGTRMFRAPDAEAECSLAAFGNRLIILLRGIPKPGPNGGGLVLPALDMDARAQAVWVAFHNHAERSLGDGGLWAPIRGFANKAAEHAARLAGVLSVWTGAGAVTGEAMACGVELTQHYAAEALRLHTDGAADPAILEAERLLTWVRGLPATCGDVLVSLPTVYQRGPGGLRDKASAERAVKLLTAHRHLLRVEGGAEVMEVPGKPPVRRKEVWRLNPESVS
jgi:hypothetical protein